MLALTFLFEQVGDRRLATLENLEKAGLGRPKPLSDISMRHQNRSVPTLFTHEAMSVHYGQNTAVRPS